MIKTFQLFLVIPGLLGAICSFLGCTQTPLSHTPMAQHHPKSETLQPITWVELGPNSETIARTIVNDGEPCPMLQVDSHFYPMEVRKTSTKAFPVLVCESHLPSSVSHASIAGKVLPLPSKNPQTIIVLGDTGCRIKINLAGSKIQPCNDPKQWPFEAISKRAAQAHPDLVIHVGDYHYRESPCPPGNIGCLGSPSGNTWEAWNADFFAPAKELLSEAPWIFVRGNHESCARAGEGFFRFLDPRPYPIECPNQTEPYRIQFGSQEIAILDSSLADVDPGTLISLKPLHLKDALLFTHRPLWTPLAALKKDHAPDHVGVPQGVSAVFAGHHHVFRVTNYADKRPTQILGGNSGSSLDPSPKSEKPGALVDGTSVFYEKMINDFGFIRLNRVQKTRGDAWSFTEYDLSGHPRCECQFRRQSRPHVYKATCELGLN